MQGTPPASKSTHTHQTHAPDQAHQPAGFRLLSQSVPAQPLSLHIFRYIVILCYIHNSGGQGQNNQRKLHAAYCTLAYYLPTLVVVIGTYGNYIIIISWLHRPCSVLPSPTHQTKTPHPLLITHKKNKQQYENPLFRYLSYLSIARRSLLLPPPWLAAVDG